MLEWVRPILEAIGLVVAVVAERGKYPAILRCISDGIGQGTGRRKAGFMPCRRSPRLTVALHAARRKTQPNPRCFVTKAGALSTSDA
jgi:hypothetical protein